MAQQEDRYDWFWFEFRVQVSIDNSTARATFPASIYEDSSAVTVADNEVVFWDLRKDEVTDIIDMKSSVAKSACFHGSKVIVESSNGVSAYRKKEQVWTFPQLKCLTPLDLKCARIFTFDVQSSVGHIINSDDGRELGQLDLKDFKFELDSEAEEEDFNIDDGLLIVSSNTFLAVSRRGDIIVNVYDLNTFSQCQQFTEIDENNAIEMLSMSETNLAILSVTGHLTVYHASKEEWKSRFTSDKISCMAFSPNGRRLVAATDDSTIDVYSVSVGVVSSHQLNPPHPENEDMQFRMNVMCFTSDGTIVACADESTGAIYMWDVEFGSLIGVLNDPQSPITSMAFSLSGKHLAATEEEGMQLIWDLDAGHKERMLIMCKHPSLRVRQVLEKVKPFLY